MRTLTDPADDVAAEPPVLGLDGRRGRWCGALLAAGAVRFLDLAGPAEILAAAGPREQAADGVVAIGIDIPIGLPARGPRRCDLAARALVRRGGGAARVFLAPPQAVLEAPTHQAAVAVSRALTGRGVSIQAWSLRRAIGDGARLAPDPRVVEVHPELSFRAMTGRVLEAKKTPAGRVARLAALGAALPGIDLSDVPGHDDALDALACAWSARRWALGAASVLGGGRAADGTPMRIVS